MKRNLNPENAGTRLEITREIGMEGREGSLRMKMLVLSQGNGSGVEKLDRSACESFQARFGKTVAHTTDQGVGRGLNRGGKQ